MRLAHGQKAQLANLRDGPHQPVGVDLPPAQRRGGGRIVQPVFEFRRGQRCVGHGRKGYALGGDMETSLIGGDCQAQRVLQESDEVGLGQMAGVTVSVPGFTHRVILHPQPEIAPLDEGIVGLRYP